MIDIRDEAPGDFGAREALLDRAFGPGRFLKTSERLREGRLPADGLALSATDDGRLLGTVRLWHINAGAAGAALLLGPLAVDPASHGLGLGSRLMRRALNRAASLGHRAVILVGDEPYYARFGFTAAAALGLAMPGPFERHRLLGLELEPGALIGARGLISATGAFDPVRPLVEIPAIRAGFMAPAQPSPGGDVLNRR